MRTKFMSYIISILLGFTGLGFTTNMDKSTELNNDTTIDESQVPNANDVTKEPNKAEAPPNDSGSPLNNNATTENNTQPPKTVAQPPAQVNPSPKPSSNSAPNNITGAADAQGDYLSRAEEEIFTSTNNERTKAGLQPLKRNGTANAYARSKSLEMLNLNYFDHNSPKNGYISVIAQRDGWKYSRIGENIYTMTGSSASSASGAAITASWMGSEGHRANILNTGFSEIGIGVTCRNNKLYATQIFYTP